MPRSIKSASGGKTFVTPVTLRQGGLGTTNAEDALALLNGIPASKLGVPDGIAMLNQFGLPDAAIFAGLSLSESCVDGLASITVGTAQDYFLTTYDSFETYDIEAVAGSISRDKNVITYTAGDTAGMGGFTVNGRLVPILMTDGITAVVATPSIVAPVNGATGLGLNLTMTASSFSMAVGDDTQVASDWQIATDAAFSNVAFSSLDDTLNLTTWTVNGMQANTKYYVRTRQKSSGGKVSDWSAVSSFTTKAGQLAGAEIQKIQDPIAYNNFSWPSVVALSGDGNTAVLIGYVYNGGVANAIARIYTKSNGVWGLQQQLTPVGSSNSANSSYPIHAVLSGDGNTLAFSINGSSTGGNRTYVYVRSGSTWSVQSSSLPLGGTMIASYGYKYLAISQDGNTIAVGCPGSGDGVTPGTVVIYVRSGTAWSLQATVVSSDRNTTEHYGNAVSLSGDGNTLAVGSYDKPGTSGQGAVYVFRRSGNIWTQQAKLLASDGVNGGQFGRDVSLSKDGLTLGVGALYGGVAGGEAYVFTLSNGTWKQDQIFTESVDASFGESIAISQDGGIIVISAPGQWSSNSAKGSFFVYNKAAGTWTKQGQYFASDTYVGDYFGAILSISYAGDTLLTSGKFVYMAPYSPLYFFN